ncbi:FecR family protein [Phenylobacterium sp.]|jgi:transmembrane sensor|uniref:FecR family protein n=1 Tax=Phenylobacterium sp. TaxID=1871053 RepID=UPI0037838A78
MNGERARDVEQPVDAAGWFARVRAGPLSAADAAAFDRWRAESPTHEASYAKVASVWAALEASRADPEMLELRELAQRGVRRARGMRRLSQAIAACLILSVGLLFSADTSRFFRPENVEPITFSNPVGQVASVGLPDGSIAVLDTDSRLRVWPTKTGPRRIELLTGRALFDVAHMPERPFEVTAKGRKVVALGTKFDVYLRPEAVEVTLFEGRVRVQQAGAGERRRTVPDVDLTPGYRFRFSDAGWGVSRVAESDPESWRTGQLVFDDETVGAIASELNRYSAIKVFVVDSEVAEQRMSAVLRAGEILPFISAVEALGLGQGRPVHNGYELSAARTRKVVASR